MSRDRDSARALFGLALIALGSAGLAVMAFFWLLFLR